MNPTQQRQGSAPVSRHRIWKLGDDVDTDLLAPGIYMKLGIDGIAPHCLESLRPEFAASVERGDVIVAGASFGIGSSREQAVAALVHLGLRAVIAPSFSGLYFRNAFNLGLLLLTCVGVGHFHDGESLALDLDSLTLTAADGSRHVCEPVPGFLLDMVAAGGLLNQLKQRKARTHA